MRCCRRTPKHTLAAVCMLTLSTASAGNLTLEIDLIQREIAALKSLGAADVARRADPFPGMAEDYLRSFETYLYDGQPFSIVSGESWDGPEGRKAAFRKRIEQDMRAWHPIFALAFLETVLKQREGGLYVMMMGLGGATIEEAIHSREQERSLEWQEQLMPQEQADRAARSEILEERERLGQVFFAVIEGSILRTLVQAIQADPVSHRLNVVNRVTTVLLRIFDEHRYRGYADTVREGRGSLALPQTIHDTATSLLSDPDLDGTLKHWRFQRLLNLYVLLQNEASRDYLLLMFGEFESFHPGGRATLIESALSQSTAAFVDASFRRDVERELGLDVIDQLTLWIVERLEVRRSNLDHERILDTLLLIQAWQPRALELYIVRFHRDFHAINPEGYEAVVLHLLDLMLRYFDAGAFVVPASAGSEDRIEDGPMPAHLKVLLVLLWYNSALDSTAETLPRIDPGAVRRLQHTILRRILDYVGRVMASDTGLRGVDRRFTDTLMSLVQRVDGESEPGETIEEFMARRRRRPVRRGGC